MEGTLVSNCFFNKLPPTLWLKISQIILLKFWRSEVLQGCNQGGWQGCASSGDSRGDLFPCLFCILELHSFCSLAHSSFLHLQGQQCSVFKTLSAQFSHGLLLHSKISFCLSFYKDTYDCIRFYLDNPGYSPYLKIPNLISSAKSLLP